MGSGFVSVQRRFRACLDVESGLPVRGREGECEEDLDEERLCPQPDVCAGEPSARSSDYKICHLCDVSCVHQMCVSGARGAFGACVKPPAAEDSVSASDDP